MNWVDVAGSPGSGKSTICDPLWHPHELPIEDRLPPAEWHDFINEITRLLMMVRPHPTFVAALRMNNRSIRKIATVARAKGTVNAKYRTELGEHWPNPYIQTALVQRGLGFGWRLNDMGIDLNELRHYYRLMPVSIGVAVTRCPEDVVVARNHAREKVKETAHENRDFMVPLMRPCIEIALDELHKRGVPIVEIDTSAPLDVSRGELVQFAGREPFDPTASGPSCEVAALSPPPWWQ